MMKKLAVLSSVLAAVALPAIGFAKEGAIRGRAGVAWVNYSSLNPAPAQPDVESSYGALTLGASYVAPNGWFGDLGWRNSLSANWNTKEAFPGTASDDDFSRNETTITFGKSLGRGLVVFGGLQLARSELTFSPPNTPSLGDEDLVVEGKLWFAGVSKALPVGGGSLSLSGALGLLQEEAKWSERFKQAGRTDEKSEFRPGVSVGAAYSYPVTKNVSVMTDLRFQSYRVKYIEESSSERVMALGVSAVGQF